MQAQRRLLTRTPRGIVARQTAANNTNLTSSIVNSATNSVKVDTAETRNSKLTILDGTNNVVNGDSAPLQSQANANNAASPKVNLSKLISETKALTAETEELPPIPSLDKLKIMTGEEFEVAKTTQKFKAPEPAVGVKTKTMHDLQISLADDNGLFSGVYTKEEKQKIAEFSK